MEQAENSNKKSNTIQAFWVVLGSFSSLALGMVSAAILSRYFAKEEYGTYKQILYVYTTLLVIFSAGLPRVYSYFLPKHTISEGKSIVRKVTWVLFLGGLLFSAFLFIFSGLIARILKNPELERGLKVFSPIPMLLLPTLGIEGIFSTYKKTMFIAAYNTITRVLMLLFMVLPVILFEGSYITAIYGWLTVSMISLLIAVYFKNIPFRTVKSEKTNLSYHNIFAYSLPLLAASLWGIAIKTADQFYVSRYFGAEVFADFSNGFIELPFVAMITAATSTVLMPVFTKIMHEKENLDELSSIWKSALAKSAIIIYPLVIFFIFFAKETVVLLYSERYENSAIYFQISMVLNFFNIIIFAPLLFAMGKTKFYSRLHMILAIAVWGIDYLVLLIFNSPVAIAITSVFLAIVKILISMQYVSKILETSLLSLLPVKKITVIIMHGFISIVLIKAILFFLPVDTLILNLILGSILYLIVLLSTARIFKLDYFVVIKPLLDKIKR